MSRRIYNKPPLTLDEQSQLLLDRGLTGISKEELNKILGVVNYYRLRGYTYPYQNNNEENTSFLPGSKWDYIWNDYVFDSKLRNLITDALGHIEVALRTQLELEMSLAHGSRWYTDLSLAHSEELFNKNLDELNGHWNRSREIFKEHYESEYDTSYPPPAWMIFETTTFGTVSKIYSNIKKDVPAKTRIANYFGFTKASTKVFISWMQHLNLVRNICAHYSRLFSRSFIVRPMLPTSKPVKWVNDVPAQDRIYVSICIITYFLDICAPHFDFRKQLKEVMNMCRQSQLPSMGFPTNWKDEDLFRGTAE
jgi:abortive infection bacteriophage resistance protein